MSYYGYVERKPEDMQVNWGEISQGILKSVKEWEQGREDLREKLDKETRETQKAIAETPEVRDESTSSFVLKASNEAATKLSALNKMLKSNEITPREYTLKRANINSDMTEFYTFIKGFDQAYRSKTDKLTSGEMSVVEQRETQKVLNMLKNGLNDLSPKFDETGTLLFSTSEGTKSMRDVFKMGTFSYKKKDLITEFQKTGSQIAAVEENYNSSGRLNEEGIDLINTKIQAALSNKFDVADLLNDAGHTDLFEIGDGQIVSIKEGGTEKAEEILRNAAYSAMGERKLSEPEKQEREAPKPTEPQQRGIAYGKILGNLTTPANKQALATNLKRPKGQYDATNKVLTTYDDKGNKMNPIEFNSNVEAMDYLVTNSGHPAESVRQGLAGANSLAGFSWDFSAQQAAPTPKLIKSISSSQNIPNWVQKLHAADPTTKDKIYMSNGKVVFKYGPNEYDMSDDWEDINEYINKFNASRGFK